MDVVLDTTGSPDKEVLVNLSFEEAFDLYSALVAANVLGVGGPFRDLLREAIFKKAGVAPTP